jgi:hypothetical protein
VQTGVSCASMTPMFRSFLDKIAQGAPSRTREVGPPTSSNGASSFHLFWMVTGVPFTEVRATIEVIEPPTAPKLYFWALQASFEQTGRNRGGAHFGLQHHPQYPGSGAVNWGGYQDTGGELSGSSSDLVSALNNVNTRNYRWEARRPYRYRIYQAAENRWRGSITDLVTETETVVRDLYVEADFLISPMVWTEAFAGCGDAPSGVRWSDLEGITYDGQRHPVSTVTVNYQSFADGGCTNTNVTMDGSGFVQRTGVPRATTVGSQLTLMLA